MILSSEVRLDAAKIGKALIAERPDRTRDLARENAAFRTLIDQFARDPRHLLDKLCEEVISLLGCGSSGISLLKPEQDGGIFYWPVIAGQWIQFLGGQMPQHASPCGVVCESRASLLFKNPEIIFTAAAGISPVMEDLLVVPFFMNGEAVGTVWAIHHDTQKKFDQEDVRLLENLSHFAAAAHQRTVAEDDRNDLAERLDLALNTAQIIGTWDWKIRENRVYADERFAEIYGVDPAEAKVGVEIKKFTQSIHPGDLERVQSQIQAAVDSGSPFVSEYRISDARGSERSVIARGICVRGADGEPDRFPGVVIDITDQRMAEAALQASEKQFRVLMEALPNHAWTATADGMLDWFNTRVYEYSGAEPGSLDGAGWASLVHPDDLAEISARWSAALRTGEVYEAQFRLKDRLGGYHWHITRAVPVRDAKGAMDRWIGTNTDIEAQKQAAIALIDINSKLERSVEARSAELESAEAALRQSQKMEAVGQLTGGIAHDFNNMLAVVLGSLSLLERKLAKGDTDVGRFIEGATTSARKAAALTHRLLSYARRQPLDAKADSANRVISEMEDLLTRTLGERIELRLTLAEDLWPAMIDGHQLENALLNLVINARDASPDGGQVSVETRNVTLTGAEAALAGDGLPGDYIRVRVVDTGVGMSPDVAARAMEPFFTTKPLGEGTGLGLSMIYGFVKQSGGLFQLVSGLGKGTTIDLFLPRATGNADEAHDEPVERCKDARGDGQTILVVEDDPTVRALVIEVLQEQNYKHLEAADPSAALAILESKRRIDLLITDIGLPIMNGRQLAEIARKQRPHLKVLFMTGYADTVALDHGKFSAGTAADIKSYAQMMIDAHTATSEKVKPIAAALQVNPPTILDGEHQGMLDDLTKADAKDFDVKYLDQQTTAHNKALDLLKGYADNGQNTDLKAFAADTAPKVQEHLDHAKSLDKGGADGTH